MTNPRNLKKKQERLERRAYNELMYSAERNDGVRTECSQLGLVREEPVNVFDAWLQYATTQDLSWSMPVET